MTGNCESCKHWSRIRVERPKDRYGFRIDLDGWGICESTVLMSSGVTDRADGASPCFSMFPEEFAAHEIEVDFLTGPQFGCVHHEERLYEGRAEK